MKKFYYSKEVSQDESPIVFPLEHRNTMDVNNRLGSGMSARAASVNSLDLLSEAPTIPRVKTRDMTRSMSDAATKAQSQKQKLVSETDLSSSWLYKTMQASINARFKSPRKSPSVQKTGDLEQSILQDPELKPIQMKSKATKTSSCICHFATMIAISLCTVGFLASIAAIIYMEIFAERNITSLHHATEEVVLPDVALDSLEVYNLTTQKFEGEEHILNEALTHRLDGDEEILNEVLKASSTNDIPSLSNKSKNPGQFADYVTDADKSEMTELKQYINDENSKIKFQDDVTVIYEMKSEESSEDVKLNFNRDLNGRNFGIDLDSIEYGSENNSELSTENVTKDNLEQELGINIELDRAILNESKLLQNMAGSVKESHNFTLNENQLKEDLKEAVSENEVELENISGNVKIDEMEKNQTVEQITKDVSLSSEKNNSSEIVQSQDFEKGPNLDINNLFQGNERTYINKLEKYDDSTRMSNFDLITNSSELQTVQYEDEVFHSTVKVNRQTSEDYDVNTILVTIDDTEVSTDSFMSKRKGEIDFFQVSSPATSVEPNKQIDGSSVPPRKPVDIKVSLADAMKHLQKLDVNNKILTSRTKSKQKASGQKRKTTSNKDEERKRYLQRMRLMLFKQLQ